MAGRRAVETQDSRFVETHQFIQQHGVVLDDRESATEQLVSELARRGWQWSLDVGSAEVTKAYTATGTERHSILITGSNPVEMLTIALARAIRFDLAYGHIPLESIRTDFALRGPDGRIVALVEVKNRERWTERGAVRFRRNAVVHGMIDPYAQFFLLVSQDVGFVWDQRDHPPLDVLPSAQFPMSPVVSHYLRWVKPGERLYGSGLELTVERWLSDVVDDVASRPKEPEAALAGTGFLEAIRGGAIISGVHLDRLP
ncbi:MAG: hypothetical protein H0W59_07825 [Chloroflexia bacterium]|jgi:hypothetical protein|nr:hypothetical protein [Chloroflexia bacterium]